MPATLSLGLNFAEPWKMPMYTASNAIGLGTYTTGSTIQYATNAAFWGEVARRGTATNAAWTANTYRSIYSDSAGRGGEIFSIMGPTASNAGTMTFELTVDGATNEFTFPLAVGERALMGQFFSGSMFVTADGPGARVGSNDASNHVVLSGGGFVLPNPLAMRGVGAPCLQYSSTFSLRMKFSSNITDTADSGQQCGLMHRKYFT